MSFTWFTRRIAGHLASCIGGWHWHSCLSRLSSRTLIWVSRHLTFNWYPPSVAMPSRLNLSISFWRLDNLIFRSRILLPLQLSFLNFYFHSLACLPGNLHRGWTVRSRQGCTLNTWGRRRGASNCRPFVILSEFQLNTSMQILLNLLVRGPSLPPTLVLVIQS